MSSSAGYRYFSVHTGYTCLTAAFLSAYAGAYILPKRPAYIVDGVSMEPNVPNKSVVYTSAVPVLKRQIVKGDIVIAVNPTKQAELICKRVVSIGGDCVSYRRLGSSVWQTVEVPKHTVWLEGDNANESIDSRSYGSLHYSMLVSKVLQIHQPDSDIKPTRPEPLYCALGLLE